MRMHGSMVVVVASVVLAGCGGAGSDEAGPAWGPLPVGPVQPAASPTPTPLAEIQVAQGGMLADADVLFLDASGTVTTHAKTDEQGIVRGTLPPDGGIAVATVEGTDRYLQSVLGAEAGRTFRFGWETAVESADLIVSPPGPFEGASMYQFEIGCYSAGSTAVPAQVALAVFEPECDADGVNVLGLALDGNGRTIGYSTELAVVVPRGGSAEVALPSWRTDLVPLRIEAAGSIPADHWLHMRAWLSHGDTRFAFASGWFGPGAAAPSIELMIPSDLPVQVGYEVALYGGTGMQRLVRQPQENAGTIATTSPVIVVDLALDLSPVPEGSVSADGQASLAGDLSGATALALDVSWPAGADSGPLYASTLAPSTAVSIPVVPPELAAFSPSGRTWDGAAITRIDVEGADYLAVAEAWHAYDAVPPGATEVRFATRWLTP